MQGAGALPSSELPLGGRLNKPWVPSEPREKTRASRRMNHVPFLLDSWENLDPKCKCRDAGFLVHGLVVVMVTDL